MTERERWEQQTVRPFLERQPEQGDVRDGQRHRGRAAVRPRSTSDPAGAGYPGEFPFTRGIYPTMYRGRLWTMRQYAGFGTAEETNRRYRYLLDARADGPERRVRPADADGLRLPTPHGGRARSAGSACHLISGRHAHAVRRDSPRGRVRVHDHQRDRRHPARVLRRAADERGVPRNAGWPAPSRTMCSRSTSRAAPTSTRSSRACASSPTRSRSAPTSCRAGTRSPSAATTSARPAPRRCRRSRSRSPTRSSTWRAPARRARPGAIRAAPVLLLRRAQPAVRGGGEVPGCPAAVGAAHARAVWRVRRGVPPALPHADRRRHADGAAAAEQRGPRDGPGPGRRAGRHPVAAHQRVRRGAALPTEESARLALRTQQVLATESGVADTVDPLGGSYFVEALTDRLEADALALIRQVDELGGAARAISFFQDEIHRAAYAHQQAIEADELGVVGVNRYRTRSPRPPCGGPHTRSWRRSRPGAWRSCGLDGTAPQPIAPGARPGRRPERRQSDARPRGCGPVHGDPRRDQRCAAQRVGRVGARPRSSGDLPGNRVQLAVHSIPLWNANLRIPLRGRPRVRAVPADERGAAAGARSAERRRNGSCRPGPDSCSRGPGSTSRTTAATPIGRRRRRTAAVRLRATPRSRPRRTLEARRYEGGRRFDTGRRRLMGTDALIAQLERIAADLGASGGVAVQLERPRNPDHGDYATNLALLLGGRLKQPPRRIAESIVERIDLADAGVASAEVAGPASSTSAWPPGRVQAASSRSWRRTAPGAGGRRAAPCPGGVRLGQPDGSAARGARPRRRARRRHRLTARHGATTWNASSTSTMQASRSTASPSPWRRAGSS
jgi:hypothetical protein